MVIFLGKKTSGNDAAFNHQTVKFHNSEDLSFHTPKWQEHRDIKAKAELSFTLQKRIN